MCPDTTTAYVFIHGFGGYGALWRAQKDYFARLGRVHLVDLPGHGAAPWNGERLADMALEVGETLDALDIRKAVFVASSFGGLVALALFQVRPELFRSMTLAGAVPCFTAGEKTSCGLSVERIRTLRAQLEGDAPVILEMFFRSLFTRQERESLAYATGKLWHKAMPVPAKATLQAYLDILAEADLRDILARMTVPVQLIRGAEDYICPKPLVEAVKDICPSVQIDVMAGCGHLPFLSRPDEFNALVAEFHGL